MNLFKYKYYSIIGVLLLIFIILCVSIYMYYSYYSNGTQISGIKMSPTDKYKEFSSLSGISRDTVNSTIENESIILQKINTSLANKEITEEMRHLLLLQKAGRLISQSSGTMDANKYLEAMQILGSLNQTIASKVGEEPNNLKHSMMTSFLATLEASCYLPDLGEKLPAPYDAEYRDFMEKGYSSKASVILAFRSFAYNSFDPTLVTHIGIIAKRAYLSALYLDAFGTEHTDLDKEIFQTLKVDLQLYADLSEKTSDIGLKIPPSISYAYAYDIAETYEIASSTLDQEKNKQIDANYENAIVLVKQITQDLVVQHINMSALSLLYLESLHRRYTVEDLEAERVSSLIDMYIESASYSKETKSVMHLALSRGMTDEGDWFLVKKRFFEVAKKYPKLEDFIENLAGITL